MRETFLRDAMAVGLWRVSILLCMSSVIVFSFSLNFLCDKDVFNCPETVWEKKSFVFESESPRLLLNLTNYDHISLALLVCNYMKLVKNLIALHVLLLVWFEFQFLKFLKSFQIKRSCMQWRNRKIHTRHSSLGNTPLWKLN